jgi:hypothetical protein
MTGMKQGCDGGLSLPGWIFFKQSVFPFSRACFDDLHNLDGQAKKTCSRCSNSEAVGHCDGYSSIEVLGNIAERPAISL